MTNLPKNVLEEIRRIALTFHEEATYIATLAYEEGILEGRRKSKVFDPAPPTL